MSATSKDEGNDGHTGDIPHVSPTGSSRLHMYFSGHVQGVGFRFTVTSLSRRREVTGWVRNLPDGRVEAVAEGNQGELEAFLDDIREAMEGYIGDVQRVWEPPTGQWDSFSVKF